MRRRLPVPDAISRLTLTPDCSAQACPSPSSSWTLTGARRIRFYARDDGIDGSRLGLLAEGEAALRDLGRQIAGGVLGLGRATTREVVVAVGHDRPGARARDAAGDRYVERDHGGVTRLIQVDRSMVAAPDATVTVPRVDVALRRSKPEGP